MIRLLIWLGIVALLVKFVESHWIEIVLALMWVVTLCALGTLKRRPSPNESGEEYYIRYSPYSEVNAYLNDDITSNELEHLMDVRMGIGLCQECKNFECCCDEISLAKDRQTRIRIAMNNPSFWLPPDKN
jgi:hypothetical protein